MMTVEFISMVVMAAIVALPVSWYFAAEWLDTFAYRSELPLWLFAATAIATLAIAVLTVSMHAIKTARINPAVSLKTE